MSGVPWPRSSSVSGPPPVVSVSYEPSGSDPVKNRHGDTNTLVALFAKEDILSATATTSTTTSTAKSSVSAPKVQKTSLVNSLLQTYNGKMGVAVEAKEPPPKKQAAANPFKKG